MKKFGVTMLILICMLSLGLTALASDCDTFIGSNQSTNNYSRWASPVESYLHVCEDGKLMKVQYLPNDGLILAEYYSSDYKRLSIKTISPELPIFGGFYAVGNNYFVLTGQNNPSQSASVTCFAVTKYDSNWNKISTAELKDCNTTVPFNAGSARFTHSGNYLAVRTSHEMYKADDGYNHQANVTMLVDMNSMKITDSVHRVAAVNYGYVSHSFNQFVKADNDKIVAVDHGDAYPRSVVLVKYRQSISTGKAVTPSKQCTSLDMFNISGEIGDNTTGCSVGGFEITSTGYLVALNSIVQGGNSDVRNIYLCYVDKDGTAAASVRLTNYSDKSVSTPQLVKIDEENFIILWSYNGRVQYCRVDNKGKATSEIFTIDGYLSDCQPVIHSGKIIWYVWNNSETTFYSIDTEDVSKTSVNKSDVGHTYEIASVNGVKVSLKCKKCGGTRKGNVPSELELYWENLAYSGGNMISFTSVPESQYHPGEKIRLKTTFVPADINDFEIVSSDENIVKIVYEDGYYKAVTATEGKAKITVRSAYNPDIKKQYDITVSHFFTTVENTPASCTSDGKIIVRCSVCGITETETLAAMGHNMGGYKVTKEATCKSEGRETSTCSVCSYEESRVIPLKAHDQKVTVDAVAATCTKQGKTEGKKCSVCGKITVEQETVEALGHKLGEYEISTKPTCTAKGDETAKCTRCSYTKTREVDRVAHKEVAIEVVSPTCTKQGKSGGKKCSICGKITVEQETVEALGHKLGEYEISTKPTCTAKGEETAKCTRCSYTKTREVDRVAHKEVAIEDVSPTCTKQGKSGGKKCSVCGKITVEQETVEALGHNLGKYEISKKPTCTAKGEETAKCSRCSYTKTRDADKIAHTEVTVKATSPTCTKSGKSEGKKCSVCDKITVEQEIVEALGHKLGKYEISKKPTCTAKGEETAKCTRCSNTKTREVDKIDHTEVTVKATSPTCTKSGKSEGKKCSVCDKITVEQETVEALGHKLGKYEITKKTTCTAKGEESAKCTRCSYTKTREVDKLAHTEVAIKATSPTCSKQGKKEGKKCSVCDKITVEQETVDALGHKLGEYEISEKPTCAAKGEETAKCTRCSYTKTRDVDKIDHTEVTVKATSPTCTKSGKSEGKKCSVCSKIIVEQKSVDALGHELGKYKNTKEATCSAMGEKTAECSRCSYTKTADISKLEHKKVTLKAVKATCTKTGKTNGKKCSLCDKILVAQESVPALGHSKKTTVIDKATTKANGKISTKCERCGKDYGETRVYRIQSVTLSTSKYTCDGKVKTPKVTVIDYNKDPLVKDKDYTVTYQKGRKSPGKYKVTIKFKGEYSGTTTLYFEIKLAKVSGLTATAGKAAVTLKWSAVKGADGYQVYYSTSKDGKYKKLVSTSKVSLKKTGLTSGKTYYFKVRAYKKTDSATLFGSFSSVKSAKIK